MINFMANSLIQKGSINNLTDVLLPTNGWKAHVISLGSDDEKGLLMWILGVLADGASTPGQTKSFANNSLIQLPPSNSSSSSSGSSGGSSTGTSGTTIQEGTIVVTNSTPSSTQVWVDAQRATYDNANNDSINPGGKNHPSKDKGNKFYMFFVCYPPEIDKIRPLTATYPYLNTSTYGLNYNKIDNVYNDVYNYYGITNSSDGTGYTSARDGDDNVYGFANTDTRTDSKGAVSTVSATIKLSIAELSLTQPIFYEAWRRAASGYLLDYQHDTTLTATKGYTITYNPALYPGYCVFLLSNGATDISPLTANLTEPLSITDQDAIQNVGLTLHTQSGNFNIPANYVTAAYLKPGLNANYDNVGGSNLLTNFNRRGFTDTTLYFGQLAPVCVRVSLSQLTMNGSTIATPFQDAYKSIMTKLYLKGLLLGWSKRITGNPTVGFELVPPQIVDVNKIPVWYLCTISNVFAGIPYGDGTTVRTFSGTINTTSDVNSIASILGSTTYTLNTFDGKDLVIALTEHELFSVLKTNNAGMIGSVKVLPITGSTYVLTKDSSLEDGVTFYRRTWPQNVPIPEVPYIPPTFTKQYGTTIIIIIGILLFVGLFILLVIFILRLKNMSPKERFLLKHPLPPKPHDNIPLHRGESNLHIHASGPSTSTGF
jgi:hypothetical protein